MSDVAGSVALLGGRGTVVVGSAVHAVFSDLTEELLGRVGTLVDAGGQIGDLLEIVTGAGLRILGDFVIAQQEHDGLRVVVRGAGTARITTTDGVIDLQARDVRTWAEHVIRGAVGYRLDLGDPTGRPDGHRLWSGVVPGGGLIWPLGGSVDRSVDVPADRPVDVVAEESVGAPGAESGAAAVDALIDVPGGLIVGPSATASPVSGPFATPPSGPVTDVGTTADLRNFDEVGEQEPAGASQDGPIAGPPVRPTGEDVHDYDDLYGRTIDRSVQDAAVRDSSSESLEPPPAAGLISVVPGSGSGRSGGSSPVGPVGDHDGLTVSTAELRALRGGHVDGPTTSAGTAVTAATGGPMVQALVCPAGHPNPPHDSACRRCAAPLTGAPAMVARPPLGRLVMSTGAVIELSRPVVLGRQPRLEGRIVGEVPSLVRIDGGQGLSRSHVMVRLEAWQVLVEDLGSANGTVVTLPGRPPQRLRPGEPVLLEPGAEIDLGGEVTGTYDLPR